MDLYILIVATAKLQIFGDLPKGLSPFLQAQLNFLSDTNNYEYMKDKTAVSKGADFVYKNTRYQVKANRPSGKKGSRVTMVPKASNYEWDKLIWILYDKEYEIQEAWEWSVQDYKLDFDNKKRLSPDDYRKGKCLYQPAR